MSRAPRRPSTSTAGLGHARDIAMSDGLGAAIEDAQAQWRNAPGPIPGLHGAVEAGLNPSNWVQTRLGGAVGGAIGGAVRGAVGQIGEHLPPLPNPFQIQNPWGR